MEKIKPIITNRLVLRRLDKSDLNVFFEYRSDPDIYKYQLFKPKEIKEAEDFILKNADYPNIPDSWFQLAVFLKVENILIGDIGLHFYQDKSLVEIGYTIASVFQRKGYAYESLKSVINYLFLDLKKHKITASVDPDNFKSINLLLKLGFKKEKNIIEKFQIDGSWFNSIIFTLLYKDWNDIHCSRSEK